MSADQAGPMILVIGSCDDFLHVYQDERELLADDGIGAGETERCGPVEFFDSEGHRLVAEYDRQWRLLRLVRATGAPTPTTLHYRVGNCLAGLRRYIEHNPQQAALHGTTLEHSLESLRVLESMGSPACLRELVHSAGHHHSGGAPSFDGAASSDGAHIHVAGISVLHRTGNPIHNWFHGAGWQL